DDDVCDDVGSADSVGRNDVRADWAADCEHAGLCGGWAGGAGAGGGGGGALHRGSGPGAGLSESARPDGGEVCAGSVRAGAGGAAVSDGGPGAVVGGRDVG